MAEPEPARAAEPAMGWREVIIQTVWDYTGCTDARAETTAAGIEDRLAEMPAASRIALARELLVGTGRVVARDVEERTPQLVGAIPGGFVERITGAYNDGWNDACAAMLGDG